MKKLLLSFTLFFIGFSNAQNLIQSDFSTFTSNAQLSGQGNWTNNSSLPGGGGTASAGGTNSKVVALPVSYLNYGSSINSIEIKPNSDGCGTAFTPVTSGDLYVSFILNLSTVKANNNSDFFRILSGDNFNTACRIYATITAGGFFIGTAKGANGNAITFTPSAYNLNQDHLIIIKYSQVTGTSNDVVSVYVDPIYADGEPAIPTISTSIGADQSGTIDRLTYRQNWTNGMPTGRSGLNSVALTWADLTFQPLAINQFSNSSFIVTANEVKSGILSIKSNLDLEKATLIIYDIQGRTINKQTISLTESVNSIAINPIANQGIYIVEITAKENRFTQKIMVR